LAIDTTTVTKRVLVADADSALRQSVVGFVSARGYHVDQTDSGTAAADLLASQRVDVLVADVDVADKGALELLGVAQRVAPSTRTIVVGRDLSPEEREGATRLGAIRVLVKPLSLLDLADAVDLAADCANGFHGRLHRLALTDVLQMYHVSGASVTLRVLGAVSGRLVFSNGEIVHAECDDERGHEALVRLLAARTGYVETAPAERVIPTMAQRFDALILDSLRMVDEGRLRPTVRPITKLPSGEFSFDGLFDELRRRPTWRPPALLTPEIALLTPEEERSSRVVKVPAPDGESSAAQAVRRALARHSPGAFAWVCNPSAGWLQRVDEWESPADLAVALRAFGVALALAQNTDPAWANVELTYGAFVVALVRRGDSLLAVARVATGDDMLRRFRFELTLLRRWWLSEAADAA
jgi:CheY-like chemotaxis protein